jgi:UDP:flavonoid glycosyltransferase YjiC (YdhE family)
VRVLRERHGIVDASPFSYFDDVSPDLNLYSEPPQFLPPEERRRFEPLEFFGSLRPDVEDVVSPTPSPFGGDGPPEALRVYVSFGTIIWRFFAREALEVMDAIADAVGAMPDARAVISLGGRPVIGRAATLTRPNVHVAPYVDQVRVLRDANVYVTHNGLSSTHEAIYHVVPMVSYPFFWDQPALAARCQALGLALPLVPGLRQPVSPDDVRTAFARVGEERRSFAARLEDARAWELDTVRARPAIIRRLLERQHDLHRRSPHDGLE